MTISMHAMTVDTFVSMLSDLSHVLDKGAAHAETKKFGADVLVNARLAPDMYNLARQVQLACDNAKGPAARLIGKEPPRHEDSEKTIEELKARIAKTVDYLKSIKPSEFDGTDERTIRMDLQNGLELKMSGTEFLRDWALPNFYFHVVTAYDILRHNGVEIGKRDFMGHVSPYISPKK
jgi:hypothetical protein